MPRALLSEGEDVVAGARKIPKKPLVAEAGSRSRGPRRLPASAPFPAKPTPAEVLVSEQPTVFYVGVGASAGGLDPMEDFFRHMPSDSGMVFVVVSHQHAGHVSHLPSLLGKCTAMPVAEVVDGMQALPNHVYLAPGGTNMAILHGVLHHMGPAARDRIPLPIDYFFRSLAEDQKQGAIGIILSGTGTDGTLGLRAIKAESGMTIAQDPQSATYQGMPSSAIAAGVIDVVQPSGQMSETLRAYAHNRLRPVTSLPDSDASKTLRKIYILLRDRTGNDFALYKESTIHRRIERRMNLHQMQDLKEYLRFAQANPSELDALFQELLIGVTSFFRDPQAFDSLLKGLPALVEGNPEGSTLRVWVAGCSTGEEAYSLAMLLVECLTQRRLRLTVQIFASDLDDRAIQTARAGLYPIGIAEDVTSSRLQRFFIKEDGSYRVKKEIRDVVVFAKHNLLTDAPFTKLDLLSCRNVLIYLEATAQHNLVSLFDYALKPNGILFLGSSESIGGFESHFRAIDRKAKLFTRTDEPATYPALERFPREWIARTAEPIIGSELPVPRPHAVPMSDVIERLLLTHYAPAAVIVNDRGEVLYIHGHTGAFLEPAPGSPTHRLLDMAREGLRHELVIALHKAAGSDQETVRRGVRISANGGDLVVNIRVKKLAEPEAVRGLRLVTFEEPPKNEKRAGSGRPLHPTVQPKKSAGRLKQELEHTKQRLQQTIDDLQIANEESRSFNEELQSTNEELQSTNEELETTKEEMQSLNEELVTLNAELQGKLDALAEVNDDLHNLLNNTDVATIFLDHDLRVKRFTSEAKRVSNLIALDVGRPLSDIVSKLIYDHMMEDAQQVLQTLVMQEREVQSADGGWFLTRILPYRTAKNTIDGLVLTFVDISKLKETEQALLASRGFADSIVETVREPLLMLDDQLRVVTANQAFYRTFHVAPREVEQQLLYHLCSGAWGSFGLRALVEEILPMRTSFRDFVLDHTFPGMGRKVFVLNGRRLGQKGAQPGRILLAMEEVKPQEGSSDSARTHDRS